MGEMERGKSCDLVKRAQDVRRFLLAWLAVRAGRNIFSKSPEIAKRDFFSRKSGTDQTCPSRLQELLSTAMRNG